MDLFAGFEPPCGDCHQLDGKPLDSGVRYCWGEMTWRWATDRVADCSYRDRPSRSAESVDGSRTDAIRDLLESPRHSIDPKGRAWLRAELRREERARALTEPGGGAGPDETPSAAQVVGDRSREHLKTPESQQETLRP